MLLEVDLPFLIIQSSIIAGCGKYGWQCTQEFNIILGEHTKRAAEISFFIDFLPDRWYSYCVENTVLRGFLADTILYRKEVKNYGIL